MTEKRSGPWSASELRDLLGGFEADLRDAGLEEASIRTSVDRSTYFVRWLDDDYHPRGPKPLEQR